MVSAPVRFQTFLGRTSELEHLSERRLAAARGRGGIVLVAGDPGVGKSRLVREFVDPLPRRTTRVARGAYREVAQRPLTPLRDALAQLGAGAGPAEAPASKEALLMEIIEAFERAAESRTTVVILEDLHWAGREAFELLHALAERAATRRLLVVATYRHRETGPAHPGFSLLGRLLRDDAVSLISLEPLPVKELTELLRAATDGRASFPASLLEGISRRADGNPFFAEELLRYALDRYAAGKTISPAAMPISIDATIRDRLGACSPAARALLAEASLFGRAFQSALLVDVFEHEPARAAVLLDELVRVGLLESVSAEENTDYRFRHALSRDVVYGEIPKGRARALHLRIGEALAARPDSERHVESLAHHFWHAGATQRAAPYCRAAAEAARALFAYVEAGEWYERAAEGYDAAADIGRALLDAALVAKYADQIERSLALGARARAAFAAAGQADDAILGSVRSMAMLFEHGRTSEAIDVLEDAREHWADRASPLARERLLLRLGFLYAFTHRLDAAWRCLESLGPPTPDTPLQIAAEHAFLESSLSARRADVAGWRAAFERGASAFERSGAPIDDRRVALSNAALQAFALGELDAARTYQERAIAIAQGARSHANHERILLAQIDVQSGDVASARRALDETAIPERFASRVERAILRAWLARLLGDDDDAASGTTLLDEASSGGDAPSLARLGCALGALADRIGRTREADALFGRAAASIETPFGMTFAIAELALARPQLATRLRPLVAEAAVRDGARVDRALLSLLDGDAGAAAEAFGGIGLSWLAAQANERAGRRRDALRFYERAGARAEIRRLEHTTLHAVAAPDSVLTPRERELARVVATGAGNRAAALQLSISEKAVEKYLTSIYAKLGITSRAQLAAYVAEGRIVKRA